MEQSADGRGHDRIDLSIDVRGTPEQAWELVGEPGWFINEGQLREHEVSWDETRATVVDPEHGSFVFDFESYEPPRYCAARGVDAAEQGDARLVELSVGDRGDGRVSLRVVETGFASMQVPVAEQVAQFVQNTKTWRRQLELAKAHIEGS